jgi:putative transposase
MPVQNLGHGDDPLGHDDHLDVEDAAAAGPPRPPGIRGAAATREGRVGPLLKPCKPLTVALCQTLLAATGFTNKSLGALITGLLGSDYRPRPNDLRPAPPPPERPTQLWVFDFTYVPTWSATVFTAFVSDVYSRRIVGWRTAEAMPTQLPLDALEMALWTRSRAGHDTAGVVHHSDAGSQYTAIRYANRLLDAGAVASIGTVGDSYDNAMAESVIGLYKTECVRHDGPLRGLDDLELATLSWVHWFNHHRLHSMIGHVPPIEYETEYYRHNQPAQHPLAGEPSLH